MKFHAKMGIFKAMIARCLGLLQPALMITSAPSKFLHRGHIWMFRLQITDRLAHGATQNSGFNMSLNVRLMPQTWLWSSFDMKGSTEKTSVN